ncbi:unnamed protein product [Camellia sinensis]
MLLIGLFAYPNHAWAKYIDGSNLNVHFDGTEEWRVQQKEGALNDISISGRPSTLQTSKKQNPKNVISIGEDIGPSKMTSFGGKRNVSKAPEKEQAGGWKALTDLTNSGKHPHQASKKSQDKKFTVDGYSMQLGSTPESPLWYLEMEEMFELSMKINLNGRSLVYKVLVVVLLEVPNHPRLCCCLMITTLQFHVEALTTRRWCSCPMSLLALCCLR